MRIKLILILMVLTVSHSLVADVFEIVEMQEDYLLIKFSLPSYQIADVESGKGVYSKIVCPQAAYTSEEGGFVLPFFSGSIGLPPEGDFDYFIVNSKNSRSSLPSLLPVIDPVFDTDNSAPKINKNIEKYPSHLVEKGSSAYLGDRYFASVNIFPFQYNARTSELIITSELLLRVNIIGNTNSRNYSIDKSNFLEIHGDDFFLNNRYSKFWRKPRVKETYNYQSLRDGDLVNEIQLIIRQEGIYKITYEHLISELEDYTFEFEMAFDWDEIDPRFLELRDEYGTIPINFVGEEDGSFDPGDYFEFFGDRHYGDNGYNDEYTAENVYTLSLQDHFGSRMTIENGGLNVINPFGIIKPTAFQQKVRIEEQMVKDLLTAQYNWNSTAFYREDIWFWSQLNAPSLNAYPFEIQYPLDSISRRFTAEVCLFGLSYNRQNYYQINHKAQININSTLIAIDEWFGQTERILNNNDNPLANSYLMHGTNILYVNLPGVPNTQNQSVLLDYLELTYWRQYKTDTDYLKFSKPQNQNPSVYEFTLQNFSTPDISIYKIGSSKFENVMITADTDTGEAPYSATFQDSINYNTTQFVAVTENQKKVPLAIRPNHPSDLRNPNNSAQYMIITIRDFLDNEYLIQYKEFWEDQGYVLKIVDVQDIFDEFNAGIRSAEAIRDFFQYAYNNWSEPYLSHVLLLGDGVTDERDTSPSRAYNLIPFRNVWVEARGAIASDNWLACIIGEDPVADISISRISVWQQSQLQHVFNKSIHYMTNPNFDDFWHSNVTLAAGGNPGEGSFFAQQNENIWHSWIPDDFHVKRVYCNVQNMPQGYFGNTTSLISNINAGTVYMQFMGHGGGYVWADYNLLNKADIYTFNNDNYPFVASMSCYGSAFNFDGSSCIGEELILVPNKGAIAHVGFTGYGYMNADEYFASKLNQAIFNLKISNIGDIVDFTKAQFYSAYGSGGIGIALIHGCALLGDPFINMYIPGQKKEIQLSSHNVSVGDTLQFSVDVNSDIIDGKFVLYDENDLQLPLNIHYPFILPNVNNSISSSFVIPAQYSDISTHKVKFFGRSETAEVTASEEYALGEAAISNLTITPPQPAENDEIMIGADFFDPVGIHHIKFHHINQDSILKMVHVQNNFYQISQPLPAQNPGSDVDFQFKIFNTAGDSTIVGPYEIFIVGPDLWLKSAQYISHEQQPALKMFIHNIGITDAPAFSLRIYDALNQYALILEQQLDALAASEGRWEIINLPPLSGMIRFFIIINQFEMFGELTMSNNMLLSEIYQINSFIVNDPNLVISSLDGSFNCSFSDEITSFNPMIYIKQIPYLEPINQPDITPVKLASDNLSQTYIKKVYEVGTFNNEILADSLGHFVNDGKMDITFKYNAHDTQTQSWEESGRFHVFFWQEEFQKWITLFGNTNTEDNCVTVQSDKVGTYALLYNEDYSGPNIEVNIQEQELTQSYATLNNPDLIQVGYIAKDGTISYNLNDHNGIDLVQRPITMTLDDGSGPNQISIQEFTVSAMIGKLTEVPVKYQLPNLGKGDYSLNLRCYDVNGNPKSMTLEFSVIAKFDIINFANYPNPVKVNTIYPQNEGRTRFTYVLTDNADEVFIKVYTVSGRLVKTFDNLPKEVGYHEFPRTDFGWDCRDNLGRFLANGVYFYRITAVKNGKRIEKTQKMAILK